jgi:outer membrane lipoprotein-sorting protein
MCITGVGRHILPEKYIGMVLLLSVLTLFSSGCISIRQPSERVITNGAILESFSSNASLSYSNPERSISGSGVLMYRKPEQIRAVILSPFGSVLQEVYVTGALVTIIDSGNGVALSGSSSDLPKTGDFSGWRYIHWLVEIDAPDGSQRSETVARTNQFGDTEQAVFENGLLVAKSTAAAGRVSYGKYRFMQGVAFPLEITYETSAGETFAIRFDDPEINAPFAEGAFTPNLGNLRMYPLSNLK